MHIRRAAAGLYSPKGFTDKDLDLGWLILKVGEKGRETREGVGGGLSSHRSIHICNGHYLSLECLSLLYTCFELETLHACR
jgi:hypothetical protein